MLQPRPSITHFNLQQLPPLTMAGPLHLAQIIPQTLGSLRTLYDELNSRHVPPDVTSLAAALERIYSRGLDRLLKGRLEAFSRVAHAARNTVKDSLFYAESGLGLCIDVSRGLSAHNPAWPQDSISQMNRGWEIFNYQMKIVVQVVIVEDGERYQFHPFTDRSKMAIPEVGGTPQQGPLYSPTNQLAQPDTMSFKTYHTIESMQNQSLQRPTASEGRDKQPRKKPVSLTCILP
jgi:hypothetical protein